ncbi:hypothetical protein BH24ACT3_BH24ACT3_05320 [soil metagenome]
MDVPALTLGRLVGDWTLAPGVALVVVLAAALYAFGVQRLAARDRAWSRGRSAAFGAGLAVIVVATQSGVARYDSVLFSVHMAQHTMLGMVAPLLLALGAPVTLALQASGRAQQRAVLSIVHSRPVAALSHPVVAWVLFGGTLFGLYFSPLFELSLRNEWVHEAVHVHFLAAGALFCWTAVGLDPTRWRLPYAGRVLYVLLAVPFHAFLGIAIVSADEPLAGGFYAEVARSWGPGVLADQRAAGGWLWAVGDLFGLAAGAIVVTRWMRADDREAARLDRALDAALDGEPVR